MLYLVSGFFSLALQVIWQRQLCIITGGTMYSVASIISIWMVGLAIGSYAGGKIARSGKNLGALFCWTQIITGLYVLVSPALFLVVNSVDARIFLLQTSHETLSIIVRALMLFSVLAVPISLIGAGFPILSSFLGKRHIPSLYYLNAVGSVVGAFVVSFFFLEKVGVKWSVALLSGAIIILNAIVLFFIKKPSEAKVPEQSESAPEKGLFGKNTPSPTTRNFLLVMIPFLFFLSGFTSLSYEFLYNRIILFIFKESSYYSFAIILIIFILGIAAGSFLYNTVKRKIVSLSSRLLWFAVLESCIGLWHVLLPQLSVFIYTAKLVANPTAMPAHYFWATVIYRTSVAGLLMAPPIIAFGFLYPLVVELYISLKNKNTSETVGYINFYNLAGSAIGPVVTVFILIALFQVGGTLRVVSIVNILIALFTVLFMIVRKEFSYSWKKYVLFVWFPLIPLFFSLYAPISFELFQYLARQVETTKLIYYKESAFATIAVTRGADSVRMLSINGIPEVPTDYNAIRTFRLLAYLPFMAKENARSALTIAFGGGITFGSACQVKSLQEIKCSEICKDVLDAAGYFSDFNHDVINTNRSDIVVEDGRRFVEKSKKKYDVIICDLTHPSLSDSWVLFTKEFYTACAQKLNAGGVMAQWIPIHGLPLSDYKVILRTFSRTVKEVSLFYVNNYTIILGSDSSISLSPLAFKALAENPVVSNDLKNVNLSTIRDVERMRLMDSRNIRNYAGVGKIATEDFSPVQFSQKRLRGVDNSQKEICNSFSDYLSQNRQKDPAATIDYLLVTLQLREYIYQKDLVNLLLYFARQKKALTQRGLFDDELTKALTSEDVKEMFMAYFFRGNGLDRLINDATDDNVAALKTLGDAVFPTGDESELIKGALYYQAKNFDMAIMVFLKLYQKKPYPIVEKMINATIPLTSGKLGEKHGF